MCEISQMKLQARILIQPVKVDKIEEVVKTFNLKKEDLKIIIMRMGTFLFFFLSKLYLDALHLKCT